MYIGSGFYTKKSVFKTYLSFDLFIFFVSLFFKYSKNQIINQLINQLINRIFFGKTNFLPVSKLSKID